jgi:hypothetical protein
MGAGPSVTFQLVDATPYRLRYLCTSVGGGSNPTVLPNAGLATPDLRTDAVAAAPGSGRNPILEVVSTPVADQAEARRILMGELSAPPNAALGLHAHSRTSQRGTNIGLAVINWTTDADEGAAAGSAASAGFAVLLISISPLVSDVPAILDIHCKHSYDH